MSYFKKIFVTDFTNGNTAQIVTGSFTGQAGLRVYGGPTDPISDIPVYIDLEQHQIHEGETYQYTQFTGSVTANNTLDFLMIVPTTAVTIRCPHLVVEFVTDAQVSVFLYEAPTTTANGTALTVYNRNRNSANTPLATVYSGPTVTAVGTLLDVELAGSGQKVGGESRGGLEWILKSNTKYLIRRVIGTNSATVVFKIKWYEDLGV